jgi:hypothetical protein
LENDGVDFLGKLKTLVDNLIVNQVKKLILSGENLIILRLLPETIISAIFKVLCACLGRSMRHFESHAGSLQEVRVQSSGAKKALEKGGLFISPLRRNS